MKLFTKEIDKKLFAQYSKGSDLSNQMVVAKIFNPYGRGTWYLINSDEDDPDYLWAIVDLFEVEVGSVSRKELESIKIKPFNFGLERDLSFRPRNAEEVFKGLLSGKTYAKGGKLKYDPSRDIVAIAIKDGPFNKMFTKGDFLGGAYQMESGGVLKDYNYVSPRNIIFARLKSGEDIKPISGFYIRKNASGSVMTDAASKPIAKANVKSLKISIPRPILLTGSPSKSPKMMKFIGTFSGKDSLRPAMSFVQVKEGSIVATDAYKLIRIIDGSTLNEDKLVCESRVCKDNNPEDQKFPSWTPIVNSFDSQFSDSYDMVDLYEALMQVRNDDLKNKVSKTLRVIELKLENVTLYFNITLLLQCVKGCLLLGWKKAFISYSQGSRAIVFTEENVQGRLSSVSLILLMPILGSYEDERVTITPKVLLEQGGMMGGGAETMIQPTILQNNPNTLVGTNTMYEMFADGGMMAKGGGVTYKNLLLEKPSIVNETKIQSERFKINEIDLFRKSKNTFSGSPIIRSSADSVKIFREFWDEQSLTIFESFNVMLLNQANKVIGLYQHSKGGVTGTVADPEMVVLSAVKSLAKGVIISHNHPSGNLRPSQADIEMTNKIKNALKFVDVLLLDSIIITESSYYSFADEGIMALGGMTADGGAMDDDEGVDLFEDYEDQPAEVQAILAKYELEDNDYNTLKDLQAELEGIGYTFEFGLDAEPFDLRKIGQKGKSEFYAKGGKIREFDDVLIISKNKLGMVEAIADNIYYVTTPFGESFEAALDDLKKVVSFAPGGSLQGHGFEVGDRIAEDLGGYIRVVSEDGKDYFIKLRDGDRLTEPPLPFKDGGKVKTNDLDNKTKFQDIWQEKNKEGFILKVGNTELKSNGAGGLHYIYKNGSYWGRFTLDGNVWFVEPDDGKDFFVEYIDLIIKRVKADSRTNQEGDEVVDLTEFYEGGGKVPKVFDVPAQFLDAEGKRKNDRKTIKELTDFVLALPQTKEIYYNDELGDYTPSRKKLHAEIINKFKKEVVCINNDKPIAIFMGGSPASGKSSFLRKYSPFLLKEEILKVDADEVRAMLPEYEGWNAAQTHLETKDIVNILLSNKNIGIPCDFDIIYDGTMNSVKSYIPLMDILRKRGYKIFIVFMDNVPKDVIIKRALDRYKTSGRFVPLEVIEDFFSKGKTAFNELKKDVDGYMLIDGSSQDYKVIEEGGMKLPRDREYSKLGTKIKASEIPVSYKKGGLGLLY